MKNHYLYLLTFAYAFSTFSEGIFMPIYAFFVQKIGGGLLETSWAISFYSIVTGIGTILVHKTRWSHNNRMQCLIMGWFLWILGIAVYFSMKTVFVLFIAQFLNGLGNALAEPAFDAEFSKKIAEDPSSGWAFFEGTISIFSGLASFIGGLLATWYGFDALLYCVIFTACVSFLLILYYQAIVHD